MAKQDYKDLYIEVGRHIRRARVARKISQETLAKGIGLSRPSLVNIEKGRQRPPIHVLYRIAEVLGLAPADLLPVLRGSDVRKFKGVEDRYRDFTAQVLASTEETEELDGP